ncbi:MAG: hypothetical protein C0452_17870 [Pseudomonas sp.]|nr:hypothetical protein [Pseudomonas sp.]
MPLEKCFVKRFVVVFSDYYIFRRRLAGHAWQPVRRAFQRFCGLRVLSIVLVRKMHSTLVGGVSRAPRP